MKKFTYTSDISIISSSNEDKSCTESRWYSVTLLLYHLARGVHSFIFGKDTQNIFFETIVKNKEKPYA
jgi:hypothetical protein